MATDSDIGETILLKEKFLNPGEQLQPPQTVVYLEKSGIAEVASNVAIEIVSSSFYVDAEVTAGESFSVSPSITNFPDQDTGKKQEIYQTKDTSYQAEEYIPEEKKIQEAKFESDEEKVTVEHLVVEEIIEKAAVEKIEEQYLVVVKEETSKEEKVVQHVEAYINDSVEENQVKVTKENQVVDEINEKTAVDNSGHQSSEAISLKMEEIEEQYIEVVKEETSKEEMIVQHVEAYIIINDPVEEKQMKIEKETIAPQIDGGIEDNDDELQASNSTLEESTSLGNESGLETISRAEQKFREAGLPESGAAKEDGVEKTISSKDQVTNEEAMHDEIDLSSEAINETVDSYQQIGKEDDVSNVEDTKERMMEGTVTSNISVEAVEEASFKNFEHDENQVENPSSREEKCLNPGELLQPPQTVVSLEESGIAKVASNVDIETVDSGFDGDAGLTAGESFSGSPSIAKVPDQETNTKQESYQTGEISFQVEKTMPGEKEIQEEANFESAEVKVTKDCQVVEEIIEKAAVDDTGHLGSDVISLNMEKIEEQYLEVVIEETSKEEVVVHHVEEYGNDSAEENEMKVVKETAAPHTAEKGSVEDNDNSTIEESTSLDNSSTPETSMEIEINNQESSLLVEDIKDKLEIPTVTLTDRSSTEEEASDVVGKEEGRDATNLCHEKSDIISSIDQIQETDQSEISSESKTKELSLQEEATTEISKMVPETSPENNDKESPQETMTEEIGIKSEADTCGGDKIIEEAIAEGKIDSSVQHEGQKNIDEETIISDASVLNERFEDIVRVEAGEENITQAVTALQSNQEESGNDEDLSSGERDHSSGKIHLLEQEIILVESKELGQDSNLEPQGQLHGASENSYDKLQNDVDSQACESTENTAIGVAKTEENTKTSDDDIEKSEKLHSSGSQDQPEVKNGEMSIKEDKHEKEVASHSEKHESVITVAGDDSTKCQTDESGLDAISSAEQNFQKESLLESVVAKKDEDEKTSTSKDKVNEEAIHVDGTSISSEVVNEEKVETYQQIGKEADVSKVEDTKEQIMEGIISSSITVEAVEEASVKNFEHDESKVDNSNSRELLPEPETSGTVDSTRSEEKGSDNVIISEELSGEISVANDKEIHNNLPQAEIGEDVKYLKQKMEENEDNEHTVQPVNVRSEDTDAGLSQSEANEVQEREAETEKQDSSTIGNYIGNTLKEAVEEDLVVPQKNESCIGKSSAEITQESSAEATHENISSETPKHAECPTETPPTLPVDATLSNEHFETIPCATEDTAIENQEEKSDNAYIQEASIDSDDARDEIPKEEQQNLPSRELNEKIIEITEVETLGKKVDESNEANPSVKEIGEAATSETHEKFYEEHRGGVEVENEETKSQAHKATENTDSEHLLAKEAENTETSESEIEKIEKVNEPESKNEMENKDAQMSVEDDIGNKEESSKEDTQNLATSDETGKYSEEVFNHENVERNLQAEETSTTSESEESIIDKEITRVDEINDKDNVKESCTQLSSGEPGKETTQSSEQAEQEADKTTGENTEQNIILQKSVEESFENFQSNEKSSDKPNTRQTIEESETAKTVISIAEELAKGQEHGEELTEGEEDTEKTLLKDNIEQAPHEISLKEEAEASDQIDIAEVKETTLSLQENEESGEGREKEDALLLKEIEDAQKIFQHNDIGQESTEEALPHDNSTVMEIGESRKENEEDGTNKTSGISLQLETIDQNSANDFENDNRAEKSNTEILNAYDASESGEKIVHEANQCDATPNATIPSSLVRGEFADKAIPEESSPEEVRDEGSSTVLLDEQSQEIVKHTSEPVQLSLEMNQNEESPSSSLQASTEEAKHTLADEPQEKRERSLNIAEETAVKQKDGEGDAETAQQEDAVNECLSPEHVVQDLIKRSKNDGDASEKSDTEILEQPNAKESVESITHETDQKNIPNAITPTAPADDVESLDCEDKTIAVESSAEDKEEELSSAKKVEENDNIISMEANNTDGEQLTSGTGDSSSHEMTQNEGSLDSSTQATVVREEETPSSDNPTLAEPATKTDEVQENNIGIRDGEETLHDIALDPVENFKNDDAGDSNKERQEQPRGEDDVENITDGTNKNDGRSATNPEEQEEDAESQHCEDKNIAKEASEYKKEEENSSTNRSEDSNKSINMMEESNKEGALATSKTDNYSSHEMASNEGSLSSSAGASLEREEAAPVCENITPVEGSNKKDDDKDSHPGLIEVNETNLNLQENEERDEGGEKEDVVPSEGEEDTQQLFRHDDIRLETTAEVLTQDHSTVIETSERPKENEERDAEPGKEDGLDKNSSKSLQQETVDQNSANDFENDNRAEKSNIEILKASEALERGEEIVNEENEHDATPNTTTPSSLVNEESLRFEEKVISEEPSPEEKTDAGSNTISLEEQIKEVVKPVQLPLEMNQNEEGISSSLQASSEDAKIMLQDEPQEKREQSLYSAEETAVRPEDGEGDAETTQQDIVNESLSLEDAAQDLIKKSKNDGDASEKSDAEILEHPKAEESVDNITHETDENNIPNDDVKSLDCEDKAIAVESSSEDQKEELSSVQKGAENDNIILIEANNTDSEQETSREVRRTEGSLISSTQATIVREEVTPRSDNPTLAEPATKTDEDRGNCIGLRDGEEILQDIALQNDAGDSNKKSDELPQGEEIVGNITDETNQNVDSSATNPVESYQQIDKEADVSTVEGIEEQIMEGTAASNIIVEAVEEASTKNFENDENKVDNPSSRELLPEPETSGKVDGTGREEKGNDDNPNSTLQNSLVKEQEILQSENLIISEDSSAESGTENDKEIHTNLPQAETGEGVKYLEETSQENKDKEHTVQPVIFLSEDTDAGLSPSDANTVQESVKHPQKDGSEADTEKQDNIIVRNYIGGTLQEAVDEDHVVPLKNESCIDESSAEITQESTAAAACENIASETPQHDECPNETIPTLTADATASNEHFETISSATDNITTENQEEESDKKCIQEASIDPDDMRDEFPNEEQQNLSSKEPNEKIVDIREGDTLGKKVNESNEANPLEKEPREEAASETHETDGDEVKSEETNFQAWKATQNRDSEYLPIKEAENTETSEAEIEKFEKAHEPESKNEIENKDGQMSVEDNLGNKEESSKEDIQNLATIAGDDNTKYQTDESGLETISSAEQNIQEGSLSELATAKKDEVEKASTSKDQVTNEAIQDEINLSSEAIEETVESYQQIDKEADVSKVEGKEQITEGTITSNISVEAIEEASVKNFKNDEKNVDNSSSRELLPEPETSGTVDITGSEEKGSKDLITSEQSTAEFSKVNNEEIHTNLSALEQVLKTYRAQVSNMKKQLETTEQYSIDLSRRLAAIQEVNQSLVSTIADLNQRVEEENNEKQSLLMEKDIALREIEELEKGLEELEEAYEHVEVQFQEQVVNLKSEAERLDAEKERILAENEDLKRNLDASRNIEAELKLVFEGISKEKDILLEEKETAIRRVEEGEKLTADLQIVAKQLREEKLALEEELQSYRVQVSSMEKQLETTEQQSGDLSRSLAAIQEENQSLVSTIADLNQRVEKENNEKQSLLLEKDSALRKIEELEKSLEEQAEAYKHVEVQFHELVLNSKSEVERLDAEKERILAENADLKQNLDSSRNIEAELKLVVEGISKEKDVLLEEKETAIRRVEEGEKLTADLQIVAKQLREEKVALEEELESYRAQVASMKQQLETTEQQSGDLSRSLAAIQEENQSLVLTIADLNQRVEEENNVKQSLLMEKNSALGKIEELEKRLEELEEAYKHEEVQLRELVLNSKSEAERLDAENEKLLAENEDLKRNLDASRNIEAELKLVVEGISKEKDILLEEKETAIQRVEEGEKLTADLQIVADQLREEKVALEEELESYRAQVSSMKQQIETTEQQLGDLSRSLAATQEENQSLVLTIADLNQRVEEENNEKQSLLMEKDSALRMIEDREKRLEELEEAYKHVEVQFQELVLNSKSEVERLDAEKERILAENEDLKRDLDASRNIEAYLKLVYEGISKEKDILLKEKETAIQRVEEGEKLTAGLQIVANQMRDEKVALEKELGSYRAQVSSMKQQQETTELQLGDLSRSLAAIQEENQSLVTTIADLNQRMEEENNEKQSLLMEKDSALRKIEDREKRLDELEEAYKQVEVQFQELVLNSKSEAERLDAEKERILAENKDLKRHLDAFLILEAEMKQVFEGISEEKDILLEEKETAIRRVEEGEKLTAELQMVANQMREEKVALKEELESYRAEVSSMKQQLETTEQQSGDLSRSLAAMQEENQSLVLTIADLNQRVEEGNNEKQSLLIEKDSALRKIGELEKKIEDSRTLADRLQDEKATLEQELEALVGELSNTKQQLESAQHRVSELASLTLKVFEESKIAETVTSIATEDAHTEVTNEQIMEEKTNAKSSHATIAEDVAKESQVGNQLVTEETLEAEILEKETESKEELTVENSPKERIAVKEPTANKEETKAEKQTSKAEDENEDEGDETKQNDSGSDGAVIVESSRDMAITKSPNKKLPDILSEVGSKVKQSIKKVKKAITGKNSKGSSSRRTDLRFSDAEYSSRRTDLRLSDAEYSSRRTDLRLSNDRRFSDAEFSS